MTYQPHQQRVVDEKAELDSKRANLKKFIHGSPIFETLELDEQSDLVDQEIYMCKYSDILEKRIARFK